MSGSLATRGYISTGGSGAAPAAAPPPTVTIVSPAGAVQRYTPIVIDVMSTVALRVVYINFEFAGIQIDETAFDQRFGLSFTGVVNQRVTIANGYRFTLLRDGGWPSSMNYDVQAVDSQGNLTIGGGALPLV